LLSPGLVDDDLAKKKRLVEGEQGVVALSGVAVNPHSLVPLESHQPTVRKIWQNFSYWHN